MNTAESTPASSRANSVVGSRMSRFSEAVSSSKGASVGAKVKDRLTRPFISTRSASQASDVSALDIDPDTTLPEREHEHAKLSAREYPDMEAGYLAAEQQNGTTLTGNTAATAGIEGPGSGSGSSGGWPLLPKKLAKAFDTTALLHELDKSRRRRVVLFAAMNALILVFLLAVAAIWVGLGIVKTHRTYALPQARSQGSIAQGLYGR